MMRRAFRSLCLAVSVAVVVVAGVGASACVTTPVAPAGPVIDDATAMQRLAKDAAPRLRFEGVVKASLPGLQGAVINATLDVAAQATSQLTVAVRSFFEVPQQILVASDGTVTLYDATSGAARFSRGPATDQALAGVLGVPLAPDDAVALILGRAPLEARKAGWPAPRVRALGSDSETFTVAIERAGRGALHWTARHADDVVTSVTFFTGDGRRLLQADVTEHVAKDGVLFPRVVRVKLLADSGREGSEVVLTVQDAQGGGFNGAVLPPETFVLEPPPGVVVGPL